MRGFSARDPASSVMASRRGGDESPDPRSPRAVGKCEVIRSERGGRGTRVRSPGVSAPRGALSGALLVMP